MRFGRRFFSLDRARHDVEQYFRGVGACAAFAVPLSARERLSAAVEASARFSICECRSGGQDCSEVVGAAVGYQAR